MGFQRVVTDHPSAFHLYALSEGGQPSGTSRSEVTSYCAERDHGAGRFELGAQFIDLGQPLSQQDFQRADVALLVGEFAAQAADRRFQAVALALQLDFD